MQGEKRVSAPGAAAKSEHAQCTAVETTAAPQMDSSVQPQRVSAGSVIIPNTSANGAPSGEGRPSDSANRNTPGHPIPPPTRGAVRNSSSTDFESSITQTPECTPNRARSGCS